MNKILVTVSGSFHRYLDQIREAVIIFKDLGAQILSPSDPRVVDSRGNFLFVASDRHRSIRLVQDRHLASIAQSDLLWLVAPPPDNYIGQSASLELGFAIAYGIPVFCKSLPRDDTLRQYVLLVDSIDQLIDDIRNAGSVNILVEQKLNKAKENNRISLLVDPMEAINIAHDKLETLRQSLVADNRDINGQETETKVINEIKDLNRLLYVPSLNRRK